MDNELELQDSQEKPQQSKERSSPKGFGFFEENVEEPCIPCEEKAADALAAAEAALEALDTQPESQPAPEPQPEPQPESQPAPEPPVEIQPESQPAPEPPAPAAPAAVVGQVVAEGTELPKVIAPLRKAKAPRPAPVQGQSTRGMRNR